MATNITPIILSGGVGKRLWPLSRKSFPKQFGPILKDGDLFSEALKRSKSDYFENPLIVTANDYLFLTQRSLKEFGSEATVILEPKGKNTAPAIIAAAYYASLSRGEDTLLLIMPSDHYIPNVEAFKKMVLDGVIGAEEGSIILFGVTPSSPKTGYGYIELGDKQGKHKKLTPIKAFHEKPVLEKAKSMLERENFFWNSGIFLFSAKRILDEAKSLRPNMLASVELAVKKRTTVGNIEKLDYRHWLDIDAESLDRAIMENTDNLFCVRFESAWSDLGDWNAVAEKSGRDQSGNCKIGSAMPFECKNSILWANDKKMSLVGLGLNGIVAVATEDAVLVANTDHLEKMGDVVERLQREHIKVGTEHIRDYRPWGWFEVLYDSKNYKVKRLNLISGASLSLQSHQYRSEHWVVVVGVATVEIDGEVSEIIENESVYIAVGQKHRLSNYSEMPLEIVEVQTGSYFGEDDIHRYEDIYGR